MAIENVDWKIRHLLCLFCEIILSNTYLFEFKKTKSLENLIFPQFFDLFSLVFFSYPENDFAKKNIGAAQTDKKTKKSTAKQIMILEIQIACVSISNILNLQTLHQIFK